MDIAVIGGGISGLSAAYYLGNSHRVTLYEKNDYVGGHTNTIMVDDLGTKIPVDTGFIVLNDRNYPLFRHLLAELKITYQPTDMSFGVKCPDDGLEYSGNGLNGFFAQRKNLFSWKHYGVLKSIIRFNRVASDMTDLQLTGLSVEDFFRQNKFPERFVWKYLVPMGAAIWSCPFKQFMNFPMRFVVEFFRNHGLLTLHNRPQWFVINNGSRSYVQAILSSNRFQFHTDSKVKRIQRRENGVQVLMAEGPPLDFDHVIVASHADQSLALLGDEATETEKEILESFSYQKNNAILHTDTSILPSNRRAWASWNYLVSRNCSENAVVTYNMNILQGIQSDTTYCVTLNAEELIDPNKVIRKIIYHHPVFNEDRDRMQARQNEIINTGSLSFCGAYWGNGFHEDGVRSALNVVKQMQDSRGVNDG